MRSYEMHVLSTHKDLALAAYSGLPEVDEYSVCSSCSEVAGPRSGGHFFPCVITLSTDEWWVLCLVCADVVLQQEAGNNSQTI